MSELPTISSIIRAVDAGTGTTDELSMAVFTKGDRVEARGAELDFEARLHYRFPATLTEAEMKETFVHLANLIGARTQCHLIIDSVPIEVIPTVLTQLQDMTEYEVRMWQIREASGGPDIRERSLYFPIRK